MKKLIVLFIAIVTLSSCNMYHRNGLHGPKNVKKWQKQQEWRQHNTPGAR